MHYADAYPDCPYAVSPSRQLLRCIDTGAPIALLPEAVMNMNSEQVLRAERYVFASESRFEMVESMIAEDESIRHGPRLSRSQ